MKLGVIVALGQDAARPEFLEVLGTALEERGVESLWVPEHVVLFDAHRSAYPYTEDGTMPIPSDLGLLDPFVALTCLAARTSTLRLATGICLIGQRNPVYTAKQVADLDVLSRGRVEFGIGLGWLGEEYEAVGVPWRASVSVTLSPPPGPLDPGLADGYRDLGADRMVVSVIARHRDELLRALDRVAG